MGLHEIRNEGKLLPHNSGFKQKNLQSQKLNRFSLQELRLGKEFLDISLVDLYIKNGFLN